MKKNLNLNRMKISHSSFRTFSRTSWETSDFGGFHQVLYDWPNIYCDPRFQIKPAGLVEDLGFYESKTLFKLFLKKAHDYELLDLLLADLRSERIEKEGGFFSLSSKQIEFKFSKEQVKHVLKGIIARDTELRALFTHYSKDLANSEMSFITPEDGANSIPNINDYIKDMISRVREQSTYTSYKAISQGDLKKKTQFVSVQSKLKISYSPDEILHASTLSSMLDISFDKDSDKLSSLRFGKLDTAKIAEVVGGNTSIYYKVEEDIKTKPFSVCILVDESGSMTFQETRDGEYFHSVAHSITKVLYQAFANILPEKDIFVYGHSGIATPEIRVYHDRLNPGFEENFSLQMHQDYRENYDGPAIESLYERLRSMTDSNVLFIVISDGQPSGHHYGGTQAFEELKQIMEKCRRDGFVTVGIGFNYGGVKDLYSYHAIIEDFSTISQQISRVVNKAVKTEFQ